MRVYCFSPYLAETFPFSAHDLMHQVDKTFCIFLFSSHSSGHCSQTKREKSNLFRFFWGVEYYIMSCGTMSQVIMHNTTTYYHIGNQYFMTSYNRSIDWRNLSVARYNIYRLPGTSLASSTASAAASKTFSQCLSRLASSQVVLFKSNNKGCVSPPIKKKNVFLPALPKLPFSWDVFP